MFGFGRLMGLVAKTPGSELIDVLLAELDRFTGVGWEQEDDVTLVAFERSAVRKSKRIPLLEFDLRSEAGNERQAMERVAAIAQELDLDAPRIAKLKTAVAEATMNAIEHGNKFKADVPVRVRVLASDDDLAVQITDRGGGRPIPEPETPDLEAKLAGRQRPRGWGLFLVKNMVDDMHISSDDTHHTIELVVRLKGQSDGQ
jgi:anti-sigma regulatory factor (Ser/Thr protein kinase)